MFNEKLEQTWKKIGSSLCVGLDTELAKLPDCIRGKKRPIFEFNRALIDAIAAHVCAFKLQYAYYGAQRAEQDLEDTISYIHERHPDLPVILDAKRSDFEYSAEQYAIEAFDRYKADALTVLPYQGTDALKPYLERADKGVIILCKTSNPGGAEVQDLEVLGEPLYLTIARKAATEWNYNRNASLVVGGNFPGPMKAIREVAIELPFLVPGIGAQGGSLAESIRAGATSKGRGLILSASRSIMYASSGEDFSSAAAIAAQSMNQEIKTNLSQQC